MAHDNSYLAGALFASVATFVFTVNDTLIKFLSDGYALHQIVLTRSVVGVLLLALIIVPLSGGYGRIKTQRLGMHILRALCVVFANLFFYMALASLPLAEVVGIFFIAPFLISIFSVIFLGEYVGPQRWIAIAMGFAGVLLIIRPGTDAFQLAALLPVAAAVGYASFHIMTRHIGRTETTMSMTFYVPLVFVVVSGTIGILVGDGSLSGQSNPSLEFLFRPWILPAVWDFVIMVFIGFGVTLGGYCVSKAYQHSDAALIAPFEYNALLYAALFGWVFFAEWPDGLAWVGLALVLASGLFLVWREAVNRRTPVAPPNAPR